MALNTFCNVCPTGCTQTFLPVLNPNQDCVTPQDLVYSQVCGIIFIPCSGATEPTAFDDASIATWAANEIDNADATGTKARYLVVEGGIAAAEKTTVELPKRKTKTVSKTWTLAATVRNLGDLNYAFLKDLEAGCSCFRIMIETVGGRLLSYGVAGIGVESYDADIVYDAGRDSFEQGTIEIKYSGCASPDRVCSPFAE